MRTHVIVDTVFRQLIPFTCKQGDDPQSIIQELRNLRSKYNCVKDSCDNFHKWNNAGEADAPAILMQESIDFYDMLKSVEGKFEIDDGYVRRLVCDTDFRDIETRVVVTPISDITKSLENGMDVMFRPQLTPRF